MSTTEQEAWIAALAVARRARGLTQAEIAQRMGVNQSSISNIESCPRRPSVKTIAAYAKAVGYRMVVSFEPLDEEGPAS